MSAAAHKVDLGELLELVDMEWWLDREGVQYRVTHGSRGTQLNIKECPVCGSNSWKVYLNADTGLGNCFAGDHPPGENYNKFSFIKASLGLGGGEAVDHIKEVARELGWRAPRKTAVEVQLEKPDLALPESFPVPINGKNLRYLAERNIDVETAAFFHLRFSKKGVFWYRTEDGKVRYQNYANRIIIPIFDLNGELVSFQGRDITGEADKKYLFPPGYSSTGRFLYNGQNVKGLERIAIGEGAFDVMAVKIALDGEMALRDVGVVGTFGKHLSYGAEDGRDQLGALLELKRMGLKEATFIWDGEIGALDAAADAAQMVKSVGLSARIAVLPPYKDPNEVAPAVVRQAFWSAIEATPGNLVKLRMNIRKVMK
jgi:DNA primase